MRVETTYEVEYTEDIVRDAVRTFVWNRGFVSQKGLWFAEILMLAGLIWLLSEGDQTWFVGALGAMLLLPLILIVSVSAAHYRNTVGKFRSMQRPVADITFGEDGLAIASELGSGSIPWSGMSEVWQRPAYWMIFMAPNQFITLPIQSVSEADRDLLLAKMCRRSDA